MIALNLGALISHRYCILLHF